AYAYNPHMPVGASSIESPLKIVSAVPQSNLPGERYINPAGDTLAVYRLGGNSPGNVIPIVVDPAKTTGHSYNIMFNDDDTWSLIDSTLNEIKLTKQKNQNGDDDFIIVDGILVKVNGYREGFAADGGGIVEIAYGGQPLPEEGYDYFGRPFNGNCVWHSPNWYSYDEQNQIYIISSGGGDGSLARLEQFASYINGRDFEFRFTESGGFGVYAFTTNKIAEVPFELWDIGVATPNDPSDDKRMIPFLHPATDGREDDLWGELTGPGAFLDYPTTDWVYWMDPEPAVNNAYERFAQAALNFGGAGNIYSNTNDGSPQGYWANLYGSFVYPVGPVVFLEYDQDSIVIPPAGTTIRFNTNKVNGSSDVFGFKAPAVVTDNTLAKEDVKKIKAFPNPYYAAHSNELYANESFITFSHLPSRASIKIFDLAGYLVRRIEKNDTDQYYRWDLMNDYGVDIASGVFIVHIDMPELGETKILKIAVIQKK
ncbi:MAG: hypothetical protein R6W90_03950, partial [Ignavibacteriaceae bacterium]